MDDAFDDCIRVIRRPHETWLRLQDNYAMRLEFEFEVFRGQLVFDGEELRTPNLALIYQLNRARKDGENGMVDLLRTRWGELIAEMCRWANLRSRMSGELGTQGDSDQLHGRTSRRPDNATG
jgi:hypothetical protein